MKVTLVAICALLGALALPAGTSAATPCPAPRPMAFSEPSYVDTRRAGGEPMITSGPDGSLLYAAHAGKTHFYGPAGADQDTAAFVENYEGQTYLWRSTDDGASWEFVPRDLPANVPGSGFSDPDFAIDDKGNVFISEINLVNVAMSKSTDAGKTFVLQNFFAQTMTDRQWSEADTQDVVYLVGNAFFGGTSPTKPAGNIGHFLYRSTDGGKTFSAGVRDEEEGSGLGDLRIDRRNGTLYEAHYDGRTLSMAAFRNARRGDLTPDVHTIARGVDMLSDWPAIDVDREGNLYIVWDESGRGDSKRTAGIWYSSSTDGGRSWLPALRVDTDDRTDIWPWLAVGDPGRVAVAWFEASKRLERHDAQEKGDHGWRVVTAQSLSGTGCTTSPTPTFTVSTATTAPFHRGTVCQGGTACQALAIDRRLGDYFAIAIDPEGMLVAAYSDTRRGGSVALPAFFRQTGGESFRLSDPASGGGSEVLGARTRRTLPATGTGALPAMLALLALTAVSILRRSLGRH